MDYPRTLRELRAARYQPLSVKDELRLNLIRKLRTGEKLFPGIVGYQDTVIPQLINAILSRHNVILLGLRGQAKSRIIRLFTIFSTSAYRSSPGLKLTTIPFRPISAYGRQMLEQNGDLTPVEWIGRDARFVEKLATPDVTVATSSATSIRSRRLRAVTC
jgi:magnesium chelatase subunit I